VLGLAQKALIAYAAGNGTPGRLPCPDTDNDGVEDCPVGPAPAQLGRLPWKTLGLADLRDGSGECLWYAVSGNFMDGTALVIPVNSDTTGQFTIKDGSGNVLAANAIAVILAPNIALQGQDRTPSGNFRCAGNTTASNYLDTANGVNNATAPPTTFVAAPFSDTYNDRLVFITPAQFFPAIERRVAGEIKKMLTAYYGANGYYPFANGYLDPSYNCTSGSTQGRVPLTIGTTCPPLGDWSPPGVPAWFTNDQWNFLTYYAVDPACAYPGLGCLGTLTVQNGPAPTNNKQAVLIEPGPGLSALGQPTPCVSVANCLDGPNYNNITGVYLTQPGSPNFNDVVVIVAP